MHNQIDLPVLDVDIDLVLIKSR